MVIVLENPAFGASGKFRNFGYFIWAERSTLVQDNLGVKLLKKFNEICFLFKWAQNKLKYISNGRQIIASKFSIISSQCHFLNSLYHSFSAVVGTIGKFLVILALEFQLAIVNYLLRLDTGAKFSPSLCKKVLSTNHRSIGS